jgi:hypothetical protein
MLASSGPRRPLTPDDLLPPTLSAALDRVDLSTRRMFPGKLQGERRSKARGRSVEFEDFRPYVPGDDLRHIDWNVFARLDKFFIKIFQEEQDLALHIVLDCSPSMDAGTPSKLLFAQRVAMALGYLGLVNNNRVALWLIGSSGTGLLARDSSSGAAASSVKRLPPMRGRTSVQRLANFLISETWSSSTMGGAGSSPASDGATSSRSSANTFTSALRTIAATRTGRGIMVILSDLLIPEGYQEGLSLLAGNGGSGGGGWDTILIQTLSPGEMDPFLERSPSGDRMLLGDLRLTDAETGRTAEVTVTADLVKRYQQRLDAYQKNLHAFAAARGMQHLVARSDSDIATLLLDDLRRRGLVQ